MKIIAIEEHWNSLSIRDALDRLPDGARDESVAFNAMGDNQARLEDTGQGRIEAMDAAGIDVSVLSVVTPATQALPAADAVALARDANDEATDAVRAHPERFRAFATLPTRCCSLPTTPSTSPAQRSRGQAVPRRHPRPRRPLQGRLRQRRGSVPPDLPCPAPQPATHHHRRQDKPAGGADRPPGRQPGGSEAGLRARRDREDGADGALGPAERRRFPRRAAVRGPAGLRPGGRAGGGSVGRPRVPGGPRGGGDADSRPARTRRPGCTAAWRPGGGC
jgi:hypothetical protein